MKVVDADHWAHSENPVAVNEGIKDWVEETVLKEESGETEESSGDLVSPSLPC